MFSIAYKAPFRLPREQNIVGHTATSIQGRQSSKSAEMKRIIATENSSQLGTASRLARKEVKVEQVARVRSEQMHSGSNWTLLMWVLIYVVIGSAGFAQDIVLIDGRQPSAEQQTIRRLADFYGLKFDLVEVGSPEENFRALARLKATDTLAVLVSQDALAALDHKHVQMALHSTRGRSIPLLVFGVAANQDQSGLQFWSGGAVQECVRLANDFLPKVLKVAEVAPITGTLAGVELPAVASPACAMQPGPAPSAQTVLSARGPDGTKAALLVRVQASSGERFFVPQMKPFDRSWIGDPWGLPEAFSSMAPFILFLSYTAGEYAWHFAGHYANLTIDDAWLTQPYGHLDYPALLAEMEKHNFHTTIAFIPWNFDRSEPDTAALFRAHPERFSICVHGNDHEHREFGDYALNSLPEQIANIKQGIARMERFQALTGIPYDRFMVFPQGVAPEATFAALKTYEFLGTANYQNVPLGTPFPTDAAFLLRPYTVSYGNLLSYSRYNASGQVPHVEIAVQSFLGNPVLLYGHESVFDSGITAFNDGADFVNKLQPGTSWVSLGDIARHSYLLRRRKDGGFDVGMLSNEMDLKNPTDADVVFYIQRATDAAVDFSLTVDGAQTAFEHSEKLLTLRMVIPGGQVKKIRVAYQNDFDPLREDIGKRKLHANVLRRISDFRDLYLSRSSAGQVFTRFYYRHGWASIEQYAERNWWVGLVGVGIVVTGIRYRRRRARRRLARAAIAR
jgi:peptidoglycan/xylan/chitin deacetylase (PgdA/CDA1 family)